MEATAATIRVVIHRQITARVPLMRKRSQARILARQSQDLSANGYVLGKSHGFVAEQLKGARDHLGATPSDVAHSAGPVGKHPSGFLGWV